MEDEDFSFIAILLRVLQRSGEEGIDQVVLQPDVLSSPDVPSFVLVWEATVNDGVRGNHIIELAFKQLRDLTK